MEILPLVRYVINCYWAKVKLNNSYIIGLWMDFRNKEWIKRGEMKKEEIFGTLHKDVKDNFPYVTNY